MSENDLADALRQGDAVAIRIDPNNLPDNLVERLQKQPVYRPHRGGPLDGLTGQQIAKLIQAISHAANHSDLQPFEGIEEFVPDDIKQQLFQTLTNALDPYLQFGAEIDAWELADEPEDAETPTSDEPTKPTGFYL